MIRRPWLIYAIAVWILFQQAYAITIPLQMGMMKLGFAPNLPKPFLGVVFLAEIIVLVGLVQLRKFARIVSIALMAVATFVTGLIFLKILLSGHSPETGKTYQIQTYLAGPILIVGDISIIWYLARRRFGELSQQFRTQVFRSRTECDLAQANADLKKNFIWRK